METKCERTFSKISNSTLTAINKKSATSTSAMLDEASLTKLGPPKASKTLTVNSRSTVTVRGEKAARRGRYKFKRWKGPNGVVGVTLWTRRRRK